MGKLKISLIALIAILLVACNGNQAKNDGYIVKGSIEGVSNTTLIVKTDRGDKNPRKVEVKDGKFTIKGGHLNEPLELLVEIKEKNCRFSFFVENGETVYEAKYIGRKQTKGLQNDWEVIKLTGSVVNDHRKYISDETKKLFEKYTSIGANGLITYTREQVDQKNLETNKLYLDFIKSHPKAYYSSYLVSIMSRGEDVKGTEELLSLLDPELDNSYVRSIKAKISEMSNMHAKISDVIKAKNVTYKVASSFKGGSVKNVAYLSIFSNNNLCALTKQGEVKIVSTNGEVVSEFKPELPKIPSTVSVNSKDQIYVIYPVTKTVENTVRGKKFKREVAVHHKCAIYSLKGELQNTLDLKNVKSAKGARIADDNLIVADYGTQKIVIFDANTGERKSELKGMRPCCNILDFSINDKNEILVANLGAFRVNAFDMTGKSILAFGKRGRGIDEFHGCCNPVSVAYLKSGAIVTVEKDPTRIKVYSSEGAKQIEGIQELVEGCLHIPMIVDKEDNLYLASPEKGLVKCVIK